MKRGFLLGLFCLALAIAPALAQDDPTTFTWGTFGNPIGLDSMIVTDGISFRIIEQGCDSLLTFVGSSVVAQPNLATSWDVSEDGLTWAFQLRDDVSFHDGSPFNAEAVAYNFNRWWAIRNHPEHFEEYDFSYYEYFYGGFDDDSVIASVEATGEFEVTFTLREANGVFLTNMAADDDPASIAPRPSRNTGRPMAARKSASPAPAPSASWNGCRTSASCSSATRTTGARSTATWIASSSRSSPITRPASPPCAPARDRTAPSRSTSRTWIRSSPTKAWPCRCARPLNILYLAINHRVKELQDVRVRQAISMALDRAAIVEALLPARRCRRQDGRAALALGL